MDLAQEEGPIPGVSVSVQTSHEISMQNIPLCDSYLSSSSGSGLDLWGFEGCLSFLPGRNPPFAVCDMPQPMAFASVVLSALGTHHLFAFAESLRGIFLKTVVESARQRVRYGAKRATAVAEEPLSPTVYLIG